MSEYDADARSAEACPVCGGHRLALVPFPGYDTRQFGPYDELFGIKDPAARPDLKPSIGCLACGSEWTDLEDFRLAQRARRADSGD